MAPSGAQWRPVAEPRPAFFKMTGGAQWRPVASLILDIDDDEDDNDNENDDNAHVNDG